MGGEDGVIESDDEIDVNLSDLDIDSGDLTGLDSGDLDDLTLAQLGSGSGTDGEGPSGSGSDGEGSGPGSDGEGSGPSGSDGEGSGSGPDEEVERQLRELAAEFGITEEDVLDFAEEEGIDEDDLAWCEENPEECAAEFEAWLGDDAEY